MFIRHKTGEDEFIVERLVYPGKNTGWLGIGQHGNVWLITRTSAFWICDLHEERIAPNDKKTIVTFAKNIMDTEGSMEAAFDSVIKGVRCSRGGYRVGIVPSTTYKK